MLKKLLRFVLRNILKNTTETLINVRFRVLLFLFFGILACPVFAQSNYAVKGSVTDPAANIRLTNTAVVILNAGDSILCAFTRVTPTGTFTITGLKKGNYLLLATYPGYADYAEHFILDSANNSHDFGSINMILKTKLLQDVIIKGTRTAIKIKGDTTEFNAASYTIQPNDKVENLLKQLPGIQIDKDGKITAQGQTVTKVLVDGEEFFGDDPTLVTKNIRADMVDKVQLYDKKSDQATFTGIDDGKTTKTINIKLKEDKKNGYFGKINANVGTDGYYEGQLIFNKFTAKQKFSVYGTTANDGRTSLDFNDASNLGANNSDIQFVDGGIMITGNSNDALDSFSGYYDGKGKPVATSGGVHYDTRWDSDKQSLNANYKIGSIDVTGTTNITNQQTLPTGTINTNSNNTFDDRAFRQKLNLVYQIKLDTTSNLKISTDATFKTFDVNNNYFTRTDTSGAVLNNNTRNITNHGNLQIFNATVFYTKKLKKVGRTFSWSVSEAYNQNKTNGYLKSEIDFYDGKPTIDSVQNINEYKTTNVVSSVLNSNMTYSEPLSKKMAILFNYGLAVDNASSDRRSYDQSVPGTYNLLNTTYSNDYKFNQFTNQVGAILNYKYKKAIFNFGTKVSAVDYKQVDQFTGDVLKRSFINWDPQANFQYRFSQQRSVGFNYTGNTTQPTIDQIQPVLVNTDPLNITTGNPDLKPSFTNRFQMNYTSYKVISQQGIYINGSYSNTISAIVSSALEDATGKTTTQYVNLPNRTPYNYSLNTGFDKKIDALAGFSTGVNFSTDAGITYGYINGALDMGKTHTYSGGLTLSKEEEKKYDFYIEGGPSYTFSTMSLQTNINNNAAGFRLNGSINLYLPAHIGAGTNVDYNYTAQTQAFSAQYKTIWTAYIFKTLTKDEKLKVSASVNDILNQNNNFSRGINGNVTTQTITSGIGRFFMLSLIYDFTKFGTTTDKK